VSGARETELKCFRQTLTRSPLPDSSFCSELRNELGNSIYTMQALTAAVKDDVMAIQKLCKISSSNGAASVYMKSWAVERVVAIMQDLITSYIGSTFERWRDAIRLMKKNEKLVKYLKYQGTRKLELFFEQWLARVVGKRFLTWGGNVAKMRHVERNLLEQKCAKILQNAWRGRLARVLVDKARADMKWKREYKGAKKIQALARGVSTRRNYHLILVERARNYAVLTIQCGIRTHNALRITSKKRIEYSRQCSALTLCRVMRGMIGRLRVSRIRAERKRSFNAVEIQRFLRGCWGRDKFQQKLVFVEQR